MIPTALRADFSAARHSAPVDRCVFQHDGRAAHGLPRIMLTPYFIAASKSKPPRTAETVDVAARHLLYKLYDATSRVPGAWHALGEIGERPETVARAVERGWVVVRERQWRQGQQNEECGADGRRAKGSA